MIKKFIQRTVKFIVVLILLIGVILTFENIIISNKSKFPIPLDCNSIIVGHSIPECAYNDSLIPGIKNIAQSGESYFYTLPKLSVVLDQNPQIENVFIEFTNNQINNNINEWIWSDKYLSYRYPIYSPFLDWNSQLLLVRKNAKSYFKALSLSLRHNLSIIKTSDYNYTKKTGGYKRVNIYMNDSLLGELKVLPINELANENISKYNLAYLNKVINVCKCYKKKIFIIRSPLHPQSRCRYNDSLYIKILKENFKDIEYLDFVDFKLSNEDFADLEHLNYKGAEKFSRWFSFYISKKYDCFKN